MAGLVKLGVWLVGLWYAVSGLTGLCGQVAYTIVEQSRVQLPDEVALSNGDIAYGYAVNISSMVIGAWLMVQASWFAASFYPRESVQHSDPDVDLIE